MNALKGFAVCGITLIVAAILQQALVGRMTLLGAQPDFMLIALATLAAHASRPSGMMIGFVDGLLVGTLSGANLQHYIASRTVAGLLVAWSSVFEIPRSVYSAGLLAGLTTIVAQLLLMFLAPPHSIGGFLADTIRTAVYNGVLAIPVYALLKRFRAPTVR